MVDRELLMVDLDQTKVIAKTAEFLYFFSEKNSTGDPDQDLTDHDTSRFLDMANHLLVHIGIFPEEFLEYTHEEEDQ